MQPADAAETRTSFAAFLKLEAKNKTFQAVPDDKLNRWIAQINDAPSRISAAGLLSIRSASLWSTKDWR